MTVSESGPGELAARAPECSVVTSSAGGIDHRLSICPAAGPIGTTVVGTGYGCVNAIGQLPIIVLYSASYLGRRTGFVGADTVGGVRLAADGTFRFEYVIPSQLGAVQGYGGGATQAGDYAFISKPGLCVVPFSVTGLPSTSTLGEPP